ncbi:Rubber oxygenase Lcp-like protein [Abortiporus biennis]
MPVVIGNIPPYQACNVKHLTHIREAADLQNGDIVEFLGHIILWDENCISDKTCHEWRQQGDPLCDAALEVIFPRGSTSTGKDLLEELEQQALRRAEVDPNVKRFYDEVSRPPPSELLVLGEEIRTCRDFFLDNSIQIMQALLHYSLAAGFASPRIVKTLQTISYLVPHGYQTMKPLSQSTNDRTYTRLLETFQFILDVMGCPSVLPAVTESIPQPGSQAYLLPRGEGWKSAVRVRMLHGIARRRTREKLEKSTSAGHEVDFDGIPISQEDLSATLASFCIIPLWCLDRLGLKPSRKQANAYLSVWRLVGYYLGVSPQILLRYFMDLDVANNSIPTIPILQAVSNRPPYYTTFEYNCAVTRFFAGPELSAHLGVPEVSTRMVIKMHFMLALQTVPVLCSKWYFRRGWARQRREILAAGLAASVRYQLGMRRSKFRPRIEVTEDGGGELPQFALASEKVKPMPVHGTTLSQKWNALVVEVVGVSVGAAIALWTIIHRLQY